MAIWTDGSLAAWGQTNPAVPASAAPVRLAIVAAAAEVGPAADLLTVALAGEPRVVLLEREQINRVWREQALQAEGRRDYGKLGELLGADGLVFLTRVEREGQVLLTSRLVAVKPGVVVDQVNHPFPLQETKQWRELVLGRWRPLWSKLLVPRREAVGVSLLNLRAALASEDSRQLERELTWLLADRLTREPGVFVLERSRMELLGDEKEGQGAADEPFWKGSYLLEGVINPNGITPGRVAILARLQPPGQAAPLTLEVAGSRAALPALVEELARRQMATLRADGGAGEWDAAAEAAQYATEAAWQLKWGMGTEAKAAAEAAWALGRQTPATAWLRVRAYLGAAGVPGSPRIIDERVHYGHVWRADYVNNLGLSDYACELSPGQFPDVIRAVELLTEASHPLRAAAGPPDPEWLPLVITTLEQASQWLRYYYFTAEARANQAENLPRARAACRTLAQLVEDVLARSPGAADPAWANLRALQFAFWVETPADALGEYRRWMLTGRWAAVRDRFRNLSEYEITRPYLLQGPFVIDPQQNAGCDQSNPPVVGWSAAMRQQCPQLWRDFLAGLCEAPDPILRLEGALLRCSHSWSGLEFEMNFRKLLATTRTEAQALLAGEGEVPWLAVLQDTMKRRVSTLLPDVRKKVEAEIWPAGRAELEELLLKAPALERHRVMVEEKIRWLETSTNIETGILGRLDITAAADEGRRLLAALDNYQQNLERNFRPLAGNQSASARRIQAELKNVNTQIDLARQRLGGSVATNRTSAAPAAIPPPARPAKPPAPPAEPVAVPAVTPRYWAVPYTPPPPAVINDYRPWISDRRYRCGRLWVRVQDTSFGEPDRGCFYSLELKTLAAQRVEEPAGTLNYEVHEDNLYVADRAGIKRFSLRRREWEDWITGTTGDLVARGGRLFLLTGDSLVELGGPGELKILASTRRRPALTPLDEVPSYAPGHLFQEAQGGMSFWVSNQVYSLPTAGQAWRLRAQLPVGNPQPMARFEEGFLARCPSQGGETIWGMNSAAEGPECLFRVPTLAGQARAFAPSADRENPPPRWWVRAPSSSAGLEGAAFWFLTAPPTPGGHPMQTNGPPMARAGGWDAQLMKLGWSAPGPVVIPVRFDPTNAPPGPVGRPRTAWASWGQLLATPEGWVVTSDEVAGCWLLPRAATTAAMAAAEAAQAERREQAEAVVGRRHRDWLAAHDHNHDGILDVTERFEVLDDPEYLAAELGRIDANTNGVLDARELAFFDPRGDGHLEPVAERGINQTLDLMAERLLAERLPDSAGRVDLLQLPGGLWRHFRLEQPYNPNVKTSGFDREQVRELLRQYLNAELRDSSPPPVRRPGPQGIRPAEPSFKARVETYWHRGTNATSPATNIPPVTPTGTPRP